MKETKFKRFQLPKKQKPDATKLRKTISQLRDYGRERGLPSKEVVAAHKAIYSY